MTTAPRRRVARDAVLASHPLVRALLFVALVAILLWPAAWNGDPLGFPDTTGYYGQGGQVLDRIEALVLPTPSPDPGAPAAAGGEAGAPVYAIRSVPFSVMTNAAVRIGGVLGPVLILSAITAWLILFAVRELTPGRAALVALATAGLTTLPFYTAQIMPDVMAGWLILIVALIAWRPDIGAWRMTVLLTLAFLSIASHYSHVPLGLALLPALGVALLLRPDRRWRLALAVQIPLLLALALNVAVGKAAGGGVSIAPSRLPILLARTLADGPGREYLTETCPQSGWTLCEIYDEFPDSVQVALWGPNSIPARATDAQRRAISQEEVPLVLAVLRAHPVEQGQALLRNAALQLGLIGIRDVRLTQLEIEGPIDMEMELERVPRSSPVWTIEWVQLAAVAAGTVGLAVALWRGGPGVRPAIVLLLLGLVANAGVCGGLSAPADRYQGRLIWTLVLLGLAFALRRDARAVAGRIVDQRGRLVRPGARGLTRRA